MTEKRIRVRLDAGNTKAEIKDLNKESQALGGSLDKVNKVALAVSSALAAIGAASFLKDAAQTAREFNLAMSNLSAITGAVGKDLDKLRGIALNFGETTTLSASQAAEALKLVASAKPDLLQNAEALEEVTKQAILLAEASGGTLELADAAGTVGEALNQFGAEADQAARFVNVLAAGAKFGSSEVLQTSEALKEAGVAAASAGISFEETNAAIQALAKNGISGSQAGTSLRNIFLKLDTDINKNLRPSVVGLNQALVNLSALNEDGAAQVKRFGLENIVAGKSLLANISTISDLTTKLTGTNTAFEQASTNVNNLDGDIKALGSAYEALQITIGSLADNEMRNLTQQTTSLIRAINGNGEALKEWGGTFKAVETAAVIVASLIGGKLVAGIAAAAGGLITYIAASLKATVQTNAMGVVVSSTTVRMNAMALASRGASAAMALVGGPLGVAVAAGAALIYFASQAESAEDKTRKLKAEIEQLTDSYAALDLRARQSEKNQLDSKITKLNEEIAARQKQLKASEDAVLSAARDGSEIRQSVINKITEEEQALVKLNEQLKINSARREALAKVDVGESLDSLFSGESGSELFGGGDAGGGADAGGGKKSTATTAGGADDLGNESAFNKFIASEELKTQFLRDEIALRQQGS